MFSWEISILILISDLKSILIENETLFFIPCHFPLPMCKKIRGTVKEINLPRKWLSSLKKSVWVAWYVENHDNIVYYDWRQKIREINFFWEDRKNRKYAVNLTIIKWIFKEINRLVVIVTGQCNFDQSEVQVKWYYICQVLVYFVVNFILQPFENG